MSSKIFINLPVKDLDKSKEFFTKLGLKIEPKFTDENASCVIIGENIFVMLLTERFFKTFVKKDICDTSRETEAILAVTAQNKTEVDEMMKKVISAGGTETREAQDHGWMYGRSFQDVDGHLWEIFYMNESEMGT